MSIVRKLVTTIILTIPLRIHFTSGYNDSSNYLSVDKLQCLNSLPIEQLLKIKKSLETMASSNPFAEQIAPNSVDGQFETIVYDGMNQTIAPLALVNNKLRKKVGYSTSGWEEEKPSKIQKIFQLSVTALAFLAFGGYLLCMIVQAIKSKGTTYYHPAMMPMTSLSSASIRKKRPYRYKRDINGDKDLRQAGPNPDDMHKIMIHLSEYYVKLQKI